jgi:hypothetical protein
VTACHVAPPGIDWRGSVPEILARFGTHVKDK